MKIEVRQGRPKRDYRTTSKEAHTRFCAAHPEIDMSYRDWAKVINLYNSSFRDYMVQTGEKAKLPRGFGPFAVTGKKTVGIVMGKDGRTFTNLAIDWQKSRKAGKKVYIMNNHTDGYRYRWHWFISESRFYMSEVWSFVPCRAMSRSISYFIKSRPPGRVEIYKQWRRK